MYKTYYDKTVIEKLKARIRLKLPAHKSLYHALVNEWLDKCKPGEEYKPEGL